jgi:aromatic-L-amino-acid decarboxylase
VRASPHFALVTPPVLGLSVFRLAPADSASSEADAGALNVLNRAFYVRLAARTAECVFTQTDLAGTFCVRMAVGAQRTEEKHIRAAFDVLTHEAVATLHAQKADA